jgi:hypothetical protein
MPDLRPLRDTLESIRLMDRLNLLENHLGRARSAIEVFFTAPENENTKVALLRFQIHLDNYYHFLVRLSPEQEQCVSQLEWLENNVTDDPRLPEPKKLIEIEFHQARERFTNQIRDLEGAALLSWIHTIRYYISRTKEKAEDLQRWADALAYLWNSRIVMKELALGLASGWPELTSQAWLIFGRLESEIARPWSFGRGRKVSTLSTRLENLLSVLRALAVEASELQTTLGTLIEKLPPGIDLDAQRLILEIKETKSSPHPRLRRLLKEASEISRKLKIEGQLKSIGERTRASRFSPADYADWVDHLSKGAESLVGVRHLAASMMKVLPEMTPLIKSLRNEDKQQELIARRESLVRVLIEANLIPGEESYSALVYLNWFAFRLTAAPGRKGICTRFGEAILPDDSIVQCPACTQHCHQECLVKGRCPVDGEILSRAEYNLHYSE